MCNVQVTTGVYRFTRNPIYIGLLMTVSGLALCLPNMLTVATAWASVALVNVQVRLEEEHMRRLHPQEFEQFAKRVPRWL